MPPCHNGAHEQAVPEARLPSPPRPTGQRDTQGRPSSGPCSNSVSSAFTAACGVARRQGRRQRWRRARELSHSFGPPADPACYPLGTAPPCIPHRFTGLVARCVKTAATNSAPEVSAHMQELVALRSTLSSTGDRMAVHYINAGLMLLARSLCRARKGSTENAKGDNGTAT